MRIYVLEVDSYEPGSPFPILTHTFRGRDRAEAYGYYRSHLSADRFLGECQRRGWFAAPGGRPVRCQNVVREVGWVDIVG